jgi:hypothetical protein
MGLRDVSQAHQRLLANLASGISGRLEAHFVELPEGDDARIGVALREGSRNVVIEVPVAMLTQALEDPAGREALRTRMKARRDRMMFKTPPSPLPKKIEPLMGAAGPSRGGGFRGGRR